MPKEYSFPKYPEAFRIIYQDLGITPKKRYLSDAEASMLLDGEVVLEEKLDGSTLFVTWAGGKPLLRAKGTRIISEFEKTKAFVGAYAWAYQNCEKLERIPHGLAIVGEWLYAMHSIPYNKLPDFFVAFDVLHVKSGKILPPKQRLKIFGDCGLASSPILHEGKVRYEDIPQFVKQSAFSSASTGYAPPFAEMQQMEGIVVKSYGNLFMSGKHVTREFAESFELHWLEMPLTQNKLKGWKSGNSAGT